MDNQDVGNLFCIKCKDKTPNTELDEKTSICKDRERTRLYTTCTNCGSKKSKFMKMEHKPIKVINKEPKTGVDEYIKKSDIPPTIIKLIDIYDKISE